MGHDGRKEKSLWSLAVKRSVFIMGHDAQKERLLASLVPACHAEESESETSFLASLCLHDERRGETLHLCRERERLRFRLRHGT